MTSFSMEVLKNTAIVADILPNIICDYYNTCYRSLILKNDQYVQEQFAKMTITHHSEICLLNIIFAYTMKFHEAIDRTSLDTSSYEKYMKSFQDQLLIVSASFIEILSSTLSHECKGISISTCDPNEPMFYIKSAEK